MQIEQILQIHYSGFAYFEPMVSEPFLLNSTCEESKTVQRSLHSGVPLQIIPKYKGITN